MSGTMTMSFSAIDVRIVFIDSLYAKEARHVLPSSFKLCIIIIIPRCTLWVFNILSKRGH